MLQVRAVVRHGLEKLADHHVMSFDITRCHELPVPKLSQSPLLTPKQAPIRDRYPEATESRALSAEAQLFDVTPRDLNIRELR
jgi:hypothetical protein